MITLICLVYLKKTHLNISFFELKKPQKKTASFSYNTEIWFLGFILFFNCFVSMAFEMIWIRAFIPIRESFVYAFAGILSVDLLKTWLGSLFYRNFRRLSWEVL
jgi:hypothetical protein